MQELYGQCRGAMVILHGGAGGMDPRSPDAVKKATDALKGFAGNAMRALAHGTDPLRVVVDALKELEADPQFNAGKGAALQADGQARLTAALMNGAKQSFSGVISVSYTNHPSEIALYLQDQTSRVVTAPGGELVARMLGQKVEASLTPHRIKDWTDRVAAGDEFCDTVGCLVRTKDGRLFAGTSTGGRAFEFPGRVSDSATVAGTYCSQHAGVSATGVGEQIVDDALAARIETRRRDGMTLEQASRSCFKEARERSRSYGWIAHDRDGHWAVAHLTPAMSFVVYDESGEVTSFSPSR